VAILINMSVDKKQVRDENLSWKAAGILLHLCRKKKVSEFAIQELINEYSDNRASISAAITSLENLKYLHNFGLKNSKTYVVFDSPNNLTEHQKSLIKQVDPVVDFRLYSKLTTSTIYYNMLYDIVFNKKEVKKLSPDHNKNKKETREITFLTSWWRENVINHSETSKTYRDGLKALTKKYKSLNKSKSLEIKTRRESKGFKSILNAFEIYKEMINDSKCFPSKQFPWKVGLNHFFGFDSYAKNVLFPKYKKAKVKRVDEVESIGSWYSECALGRDHCYNVWAAWAEAMNKNTVARLAKYFFSDTDFDSLAVEEHNLLVKAAAKYSQFFEKNKARIQTPNILDERHEERFLRFFFKFVEDKFRARPFELYFMLNDSLLNGDFKKWLLDMGWMTK